MTRRRKTTTSSWWFWILITCLILFFMGWIVATRIQEHFHQQDPMLQTLRKKLEPLHPRVHGLRLFEGKKSYTINKKKIYLCLRDENGDYYDENMLTYVAIHELAHVLCDEIGHTDKFHSIFRDLLTKATHLQLYDPEKPILRNYCGHHT